MPKSAHCKTRWHNRCEMAECDCDCHPEELFAVVSPDRDTGTSAVAEPGAPPPHPEPFDHGVFRIAEESPGTDLNEPWRLGICEECKEPTWSHNRRAVERREVLCETCAYMLLSNLTETRVKTENRPRPPINPFIR